MSSSRSPAKSIQLIFVGSLLLPLLSGFLDRSPADYWPYLNVSLMGVAAAGWLAIRYRARRGKSIDWFLSVAVFNLFVLGPEVTLRHLHFRYETGIQFGYPKLTSFETFAPDEELFWRFPRGRPGVNSLGFGGKEIEVPKPANTFRILFLGDSVPQQGYPAIAESLLNTQARIPVRVESASLAMAGYSTHQGRVLADKYGARLEPDLVFVSYGWNDHWQAYDHIDSQKEIVINQSAVGRLARELYHRSRTLQWFRKALRPFLGSNLPLPVMRVPIDEYRMNLVHIGKVFTDGSTPVVFITPPTSHHQLGVPDYLVDERFAADKASVIGLHRQYNQVVRDVGAANRWKVLDLDREWTSAADLMKIIFADDGIHFTPAGSAFAAERIADFVVTNWDSLSTPR